MTATKTVEIKINIARLEETIRKNCWQKGYVANCKARIAKLKSLMA